MHWRQKIYIIGKYHSKHSQNKNNDCQNAMPFWHIAVIRVLQRFISCFSVVDQFRTKEEKKYSYNDQHRNTNLCIFKKADRHTSITEFFNRIFSDQVSRRTDDRNICSDCCSNYKWEQKLDRFDVTSNCNSHHDWKQNSYRTTV